MKHYRGCHAEKKAVVRDTGTINEAVLATLAEGDMAFAGDVEDTEARCVLRRGRPRYVILAADRREPSHATRSSSRSRSGWAECMRRVRRVWLSDADDAGGDGTCDGSLRGAAQALYDHGRRRQSRWPKTKAMVDAIFARMDHARSEQGGGRSPQIERAVENFRMALRMKKGR